MFCGDRGRAAAAVAAILAPARAARRSRRGDLSARSKGGGHRRMAPPTSCSSAISIATRTRRSTFRSVPTITLRPGGPDMGQPTHFHARPAVGASSRSRCAEDFAQQKLTWTMVANGQTATVVVLDRILRAGSTSSSTARAATGAAGDQVCGDRSGDDRAADRNKVRH